jgi:hypothetical protein
MLFRPNATSHFFFSLVTRLTQPKVSAILQALGCRGPLGGAAMFVSVSREASECRLYAEQCADKARFASGPKLRQDFLDMEQRWLGLARCYDFQSDWSFFRRSKPRPLPLGRQGEFAPSMGIESFICYA